MTKRSNYILYLPLEYHSLMHGLAVDVLLVASRFQLPLEKNNCSELN